MVILITVGVVLMLGGLLLFHFVEPAKRKPSETPEKPLDETETYLYYYDD